MICIFQMGGEGDHGLISGRSRAWYVLHAKRNNERRVVEHLTLKSITSFLPLMEPIHSRPRRSRIVLEPLFPGYVFIRMNCVETGPGTWDAVRWTPGVRSVLGADGIPVPVPDEVLEALQERVKESGFVPWEASFPPRARMRFRSGPLAGVEALFERPASRAGRVRVLLTLLGRQTGVEADLLDLECA